MKPRNLHRTGTLTALAILLAGMSMGFISFCEAFFGGTPEPGPDIYVTTQAGNTANDLAGALNALARIALCEDPSVVAVGGPTTIPSGVYLRTSRDLRGSEPSATVDLVTATSTPPGVYVLQYRQTEPGSYVTGTLNLTVEEGNEAVQACLYVYGEGEVLLVNQPVSIYGCCSLAPQEDPIVQYKWWFAYNGNPSSTPSLTTGTGAGCMTTHTYTTAGPRTVRLVVRTESGIEAEATQAITVQGL